MRGVLGSADETSWVSYYCFACICICIEIRQLGSIVSDPHLFFCFSYTCICVCLYLHFNSVSHCVPIGCECICVWVHGFVMLEWKYHGNSLASVPSPDQAHGPESQVVSQGGESWIRGIQRQLWLLFDFWMYQPSDICQGNIYWLFHKDLLLSFVLEFVMYLYLNLYFQKRGGWEFLVWKVVRVHQCSPKCQRRVEVISSCGLLTPAFAQNISKYINIFQNIFSRYFKYFNKFKIFSM